MGASHLLGLDGPSCIALGVVSSIDMLPCSSGKGSCLFGHGDHLGAGRGEAAAWVAVLLLGVPWQAEQMEVMEMIAPIRSDKRWPNSP